MNSPQVTSLWRAAWRWHFYAAFFVLPILFTLAVTGLVILVKPTIERVAYNDRLYVEQVDSAVPFAQQRDAVESKFPNASVDAVVPPRDSNRSTQFDITSEDGKSFSVYVNPSNGNVLGTIDNDTRIDYVATRIHGTLWLGSWGDYLVEMVAGWTLVMTFTGLYLWWPRDKVPHRLRRALTIRLNKKGRKRLRDLHATPGALFAPVLIFLALTGLPWSGFWGVKWGEFIDSVDSGYNFPAEDPTSHEHASAIETPGLQISWANERNVLPTSHPSHLETLPLETVVVKAQDIGMLPGFAVGLPADESGVFTLSNAWPSPAQDERIVYLDQYSGDVLAAAGWNKSYGALAKTTAWGVDTHMGRQFSWPNAVVMALSCFAVIGATVTAPAMYLKRRPKGTAGFPRRPMDIKLAKGVTIISLGLGIVFPLLGLSMLFAVLVDRTFIRRVPKLRELFGMRQANKDDFI